MSERNLKVLVPVGVLGVGDHAGASNGGAGDGHGDIGITSNDRAMAMARAGIRVSVSVSGDFATAFLGQKKIGARSDKASTEALGEVVHVGKVTGFDDPEMEIAMEEHGGLCLGLGGHWRMREEEEEKTLGFV